MKEKIKALLNYLDLESEDAIEIKTSNDSYITINNEEYLVLTDEEANEAHENYIELLIDDLGINAFTPYAQEYIIENCIDKSWFDDAMRESYECYVEDIREESSFNNEYENRLEEEMAENDCDTEEDYIEHLMNSYKDGVEWYKLNIGEEDFSEMVRKYCSLDIGLISKFCIREDGRGHSLASYNGEELELENGYFAYRTN